MEWYEYILITGVGFLAAFMNTVGGGGSLFSVPILTFLGLPITSANATSRVAILFQNVFAVIGFKSKAKTVGTLIRVVPANKVVKLKLNVPKGIRQLHLSVMPS